MKNLIGCMRWSLTQFSSLVLALLTPALLAFLALSFASVQLNAQVTEREKTKQELKVEKRKKDPASSKKTMNKKKKVNPVLAPIEDVAGLPRVLLIGDSISIGYTLQVRQGLKGKANVHRPAINCGPTTRGLQGIEKWLGEKKWDVIHFNFGLHDLKYMGPNNENLADPSDEKNHQQVPPLEYEKNIRKLVDRLKKTNAKLIWRNTTPVPESAQGRVRGDSAKYNSIAAEIMKEEQIQIHDMYSLVKPKMNQLMLPKGNVHFTKPGSQVLADDVVKVILESLNSAKN